jgi:repressor LexA
MEENGISNVQLGKELGLSAEAIRSWRTGAKIPTVDKLMRLAEYFNVSIDELMGKSINTERSIKLPLVGLISAGVFDILNEEEWKEEREVSVRLLSDRPKKECVTMEVTGESMAPYLLPGDILVVHRQDYAVNGNIIIAYDPTVNGYTVKKFQQNGDTVILDPFNKDFPQIRYNNPKQQELDLYGVCVGLERKLV